MLPEQQNKHQAQVTSYWEVIGGLHKKLTGHFKFRYHEKFPGWPKGDGGIWGKY